MMNFKINPIRFNTLLASLCLVCIAAAFFISCRKDEEVIDTPNNPNPTGTGLLGDARTIDVIGQVLDESGNPIAGALVKAGFSAVSTISDEHGLFRFNGVAGYEKLALIKISKVGYFDGSRSFVPTEGLNRLRIVMLQKNDAGSFNSMSGGIVELENLSVEFTPNSIQKDGVNYTGNVHVSINWIDPTNALTLAEQTPGSLVGLQNDSLAGLRSFGMAGIELTDDNGSVLQIASGSSAQLHFQIPAALQGMAPSTIPLWYYSETDGYWKREGEATLVGNEFVGEVSHFSYWNCDVPVETTLLVCSIEYEPGDGSSNPLPGVIVSFDCGENGSFSSLSDGDGLVMGELPMNTPISVTVYMMCGNNPTPIYSGGITPLAGPLFTTIVVASMPAMAPVSGQLLDATGAPVDGVVWLQSGNYVTTNAGNFEMWACEGADVMGGWYYLGGDVCASVDQNITITNTGINQNVQCTSCAVFTQPGSGVTDIEGNFYSSVIISGQEWMASNLRTTTFTNGDSIPYLDSAAWLNTSSPACCAVASGLNSTIYGLLYNGYTIHDSRSVCPTGWHVPSLAEFDLLFSVLAGPGGVELNEVSGKMKSTGILSDGSGLWFAPNTGATNSSSLSIVPSGRNDSGVPSNVGTSAYIWTNTPNMPDSYWAKLFLYNSAAPNMTDYTYEVGIGLRCVRD